MVSIETGKKLYPKYRIGTKGCLALKNLFERNKIIAMINIQDNAITNEGVKHLVEGISHNKSLINFNISNNDLSSNSMSLMMTALLND
jgi:Ran GTPase-activating protein (RanGAP) involved in mRNA processing and transport